MREKLKLSIILWNCSLITASFILPLSHPGPARKENYELLGSLLRESKPKIRKLFPLSSSVRVCSAFFPSLPFFFSLPAPLLSFRCSWHFNRPSDHFQVTWPSSVLFLSQSIWVKKKKEEKRQEEFLGFTVLLFLSSWYCQVGERRGGTNLQDWLQSIGGGKRGKIGGEKKNGKWETEQGGNNHGSIFLWRGISQITEA